MNLPVIRERAGLLGGNLGPVPPAPPPTDMSLDQAIFEPVTGKIFGVRGQWLYRFNAATGVYEASLRYTDNGWGLASLTALAGKIYAACRDRLPDLDFLSVSPTDDEDIFVVDAATFSVTGRFNWGHYNYGGGTISDLLEGGFGNLINDGAHIAAFSIPQGMVAVDPSDLAGTFTRSSFTSLNDWAYDPVNGAYWVADPASSGVWAIKTYPVFQDDVYNTGSYQAAERAFGITYNTAQNKVYVARGDESLFLVASADVTAAFPLASGANFPLSTLHTGRTGARPFRIKSCNGMAGNPYNGKVLIPTWADDAVLVWNPATDNPSDMVVKTGFSSPIDIVHAPTASFAVQTDMVGLKLIQ